MVEYQIAKEGKFRGNIKHIFHRDIKLNYQACYRITLATSCPRLERGSNTKFAIILSIRPCHVSDADTIAIAVAPLVLLLLQKSVECL